MTRFLPHVLVLSAALFCAAPALAQEQAPNPPPQGADDSVHYGWADVLRVDPVREGGGPATREECEDVPVQHSGHRADTTGGTVIGAIVGGVLGHTVGKGDGRRAATVAGAVVGGAVGNGVARNGDEDGYTSTETRCVDVPSDGAGEPERIVAYDVEYRYRGEVYMSRVSYDPGDRLRVRVSVSPAE